MTLHKSALRSLSLHWIAVHSMTAMHDMAYRNIKCGFMDIHLHTNPLIDMHNESCQMTFHVRQRQDWSWLKQYWSFQSTSYRFIVYTVYTMCLLCGGGRITRLRLVRILPDHALAAVAEACTLKLFLVNCSQLSWLRSPPQWLRVLEQGQLGPQHSQCSTVGTSCRICPWSSSSPKSCSWRCKDSPQNRNCNYTVTTTEEVWNMSRICQSAPSKLRWNHSPGPCARAAMSLAMSPTLQFVASLRGTWTEVRTVKVTSVGSIIMLLCSSVQHSVLLNTWQFKWNGSCPTTGICCFHRHIQLQCLHYVIHKPLLSSGIVTPWAFKINGVI